MKRMLDVMKRAVEAGDCAGCSVLVTQGGREVFYGDAGLADIDSGRRLERDAVFRCFSQTKPVTGVAAVLCMERGLFSPRTPVYEFLPGFRDQVHGEQCKPVAWRPVFISDLLNMTSGLCYPGTFREAERATGEVVKTVETRRAKGVETSTVEFANMLGQCPLAFEPGERWNYSFSADVIGAVIEVATGMTFGEFLKKELFDPLEMHETGFILPEASRGRLVSTYDYKDGRYIHDESRETCLGLNAYRADTLLESGGAGLVSTIDDYANFTRMLVDDGVFKGRRILSRHGRAYYTKPQLSARQAETLNWQDLVGHNYANFCSVVQAGGPTSFFCNPGTFSWGGMLGTNFFVDPVEKLAYHFMVQKIGDSHALQYRLRNMAYASID